MDFVLLPLFLQLYLILRLYFVQMINDDMLIRERILQDQNFSHFLCWLFRGVKLQDVCLLEKNHLGFVTGAHVALLLIVFL